MIKHWAQLDANNTVVNIVACDDYAWLKENLEGEFIDVTGILEIWVKGTYSPTENKFYPPVK